MVYSVLFSAIQPNIGLKIVNNHSYQALNIFSLAIMRSLNTSTTSSKRICNSQTETNYSQYEGG